MSHFCVPDRSSVMAPNEYCKLGKHLILAFMALEMLFFSHIFLVLSQTFIVSACLKCMNEEF